MNSGITPGVGEILRAKRLERRLSLEKVHRHTRIPAAAIEALEAGNSAYFPAKIYMQGFLDEYCEYLGLSAEAVLKQAQETTPQQQEPAQKPQQQDSEPKEKEAVPAHIFMTSTSPVAEENAAGSVSPSVNRFIAISALVVFMISAWVWRDSETWKWREKEQKRSSFNYIYDTTFVSKMKASFKERVWAHISADGRTLFEGYAYPGMSSEWKSAGNFTIQIDNPRAAVIYIDNQIVPEDMLKNSTETPVTLSGINFI